MRIILIDHYSGFIWGDSADFDGRIFTADDALKIRPEIDPNSETDFAIAYAQALDESLGNHDRRYSVVGRLHGQSGYRAYRADIGGSEQVAIVHDGQSQDEIDAVEKSCRKVAEIAFEVIRHIDDSDFVICTSPDGWSIHAPGSMDDDIASGEAPYLVSGAGNKPTATDFDAARRKLADRGNA